MVRSLFTLLSNILRVLNEAGLSFSIDLAYYLTSLKHPSKYLRGCGFLSCHVSALVSL